jgi:uroporphyrinogen-III synthase
MSRLAGLGVLVTRPAHQAQALCELLQQAGASVRRLPLLAIEPAADEAALAARLRQARGWDHWIFTSANAAHQAARLDAGPWPPLAAAGAATAVALADAGHAGALVPAGLDGAAGLLADARFAAPAGQRILIVTGDNTLPQLAEGLRARGAKVEVLAVYRRVPVAHAPQAVAEAIAASQVAIVSSGEALAHLLHLTPAAAHGRLLSLQLALPSPRMIEKAREAGFTQTPLLPARVSDAAYVELLERWHKAC